MPLHSGTASTHTEHLLWAPGHFFKLSKCFFSFGIKQRCETFNRDGLINPSPLKKVKRGLVKLFLYIVPQGIFEHTAQNIDSWNWALCFWLGQLCMGV